MWISDVAVEIVKWNCCKMPKSYCCREIDNCVKFIGNFRCDSDEQNKEASLKCVIDHLGFPAICLNQWSLELAAENFKTCDGHHYSQSGEK